MSDFGGRFQRQGENEPYRHLQYSFVYYYCAQNCFLQTRWATNTCFIKAVVWPFPLWEAKRRERSRSEKWSEIKKPKNFSKIMLVSRLWTTEKLKKIFFFTNYRHSAKGVIFCLKICSFLFKLSNKKTFFSRFQRFRY